tara:strand:+ start:255 stop:527 length:273 start_codon:yes stop_codon:yes gene_type:complete
MQEHTLWKNVVLQNVIDSLGVFQWFSRLNKQYEIEAKDWIGSKDFNLVCSYADLQPDYIIKIYKDIKQHTHYLTATDIRYLLYEQIIRRS